MGETMKLNHLTLVCVQLHAMAGSTIYNCMAEAAKLALIENRNIEFTHNGRRYIALVNDLIGQVREVPKQQSVSAAEPGDEK
jgi:hypothetical protein